MPATSENQRRAACLALSAKRKKTPVSNLQGPAKSMYESMSMAQLAEFCREPVKK